MLQDTLRNDLDRFVGALLFVRQRQPLPARRSHTGEGRQLFWASAAFSGVRCILQYVVLPFVLPFVGFAANVSDVLFFVLSGIAVVSMVVTLRRFWRIGYRYRWLYLAAAGVAGTVLVLHMIYDVRLFLS